ncbi:unnamed protein product [Hyaloperonospora brassicae]|uniref:Uncharacterized protein n=1 Tax=Hyaloperonospora brassicae TaxID=162125 RepID=A0AAV0UTB4_HYABA|nr:unnamed protein product [Hyaloperonospora brassicae]
MTSFVRRRSLLLLLLLLLWTQAADASTARSPLRDVFMPPPARAHCRVFVVAARTHTRVLVLQNAYEQDAINVYDHVPVVSSILQGTLEHNSSNVQMDEKKATTQAFQILRPAMDLAAEWLKSRDDPRRCFAHFLVADSEVPAGFPAPDDTTTAASRVTRRLEQLRDMAWHDRDFPFAVDERRQEDDDSVPSSGIVSAAWRLYFHVVGINYFSERVAPSLSPGQVEVFGLVHVDAGGHAGQSRFESDANAAAVVFDVRERWRRGKRQRQTNVVLNSSDFYGYEYAGFGRQQVQQAVVKLKHAKNNSADAVQHPCFFRGHTLVVEDVNVTVEGAGDADECMTLLRSHIAASNVDCPPESFCFLGGVPQPQKSGSFYASGVLQRAVLRANRVLEHVSNTHNEDDVSPLMLPAPSLLALRHAAKTLCELPFEDAAAGMVRPHSTALEAASLAVVMEKTIEPPSALCFDLSYTVVLLEQIGVQDYDERVHFVDSFRRQPMEHGSVPDEAHSSSFELVAWLTGTFLYLEALQRRVTFSLESELLAEQLSAGLPLGWNLSMLVFLAACIYLYLTTGRLAVSGRARRGSSGYHRVVNGGAKAKYEDMTRSITFVDDARD